MTARIKYNAFKIVLTANTITATTILTDNVSNAADVKYNFEIKPANSGTPTMEKAPTEKATPAILFRNPEPFKSEKSFLSPETSDKPRHATNSMDFVAAWDKIWNTAATIPNSVPNPNPI